MEVETKNMSFKRHIIFPFQYLAEKNEKKKIRTAIKKIKISLCFDFHSNFFVFISILVNIGKERC